MKLKQIEINNLIGKISGKLKPDVIVAVVVILVAVLFVWRSASLLGRNYDLEKQIQYSALENEMQEIENETMLLQQAYYKTDEYLELSARGKMNKALPGERLVILPETKPIEKTETGTVKYIDERSNFEKWVEFFLASKR